MPFKSVKGSDRKDKRTKSGSERTAKLKAADNRKKGKKR